MVRYIWIFARKVKLAQQPSPPPLPTPPELKRPVSVTLTYTMLVETESDVIVFVEQYTPPGNVLEVGALW